MSLEMSTLVTFAKRKNFYIGISIMMLLGVIFILTFLDSEYYFIGPGNFSRSMFYPGDDEFLFTIALFITSILLICIDYIGTIKLFILNRIIYTHTKLTKILWIGVIVNFIILVILFILCVLACVLRLGNSCHDWGFLAYLIGFLYVGWSLILLIIIYIITKLLTTK